MNTDHPLQQFLSQCAAAMARRASDNITREGAKRFKHKLATATIKSFSAQQQAILKNIDSVATTPFTFNFHQIATDMVWRPSPRTNDNGQLLALSIINDMLDLGDIVAGLMLVSPEETYPLHQHSSQELYLILSGEAKWRYGGDENYRKQSPGDVIYNHPNDLHGVKAGDSMLLALYLLWH